MDFLGVLEREGELNCQMKDFPKSHGWISPPNIT